jgi:hypothetical protein
MTWNVEMKWNTRRTVLCHSLVLLIAAGLIASGLSGCGDPNAVKTEQLYPVKGKVLLADGTPLKGGQVSLVSTTAASEYTGIVGSDGTFEVKTAYGNGAPAGLYKVRIDADAAAAKGKSSSRKGAANLPFPAKYADETTSDLTVTVKPEDNTLEPFKLVPPASAGKSSSGTGRG